MEAKRIDYDQGDRTDAEYIELLQGHCRRLTKRLDSARIMNARYVIKVKAPIEYIGDYYRLMVNRKIVCNMRTIRQYHDPIEGWWTSSPPDIWANADEEDRQFMHLSTPPSGISIHPMLQVQRNVEKAR